MKEVGGRFSINCYFTSIKMEEGDDASCQKTTGSSSRTCRDTHIKGCWKKVKNGEDKGSTWVVLELMEDMEWLLLEPEGNTFFQQTSTGDCI